MDVSQFFFLKDILIFWILSSLLVEITTNWNLELYDKITYSASLLLHIVLVCYFDYLFKAFLQENTKEKYDEFLEIIHKGKSPKEKYYSNLTARYSECHKW